MATMIGELDLEALTDDDFEALMRQTDVDSAEHTITTRAMNEVAGDLYRQLAAARTELAELSKFSDAQQAVLDRIYAETNGATTEGDYPPGSLEGLDGWMTEEDRAFTSAWVVRTRPARSAIKALERRIDEQRAAILSHHAIDRATEKNRDIIRLESARRSRRHQEARRAERADLQELETGRHALERLKGVEEKVGDLETFDFLAHGVRQVTKRDSARRISQLQTGELRRNQDHGFLTDDITRNERGLITRVATTPVPRVQRKAV